jgi:hypothetical protein
MLATGAQNASVRARRTSGSRGSLVVVIRRGRIRSRPGLDGQQGQHRRVAHEGDRLVGVEPGHDLVDRLGHREQGHVDHRVGEGLGHGAGHVAGVAGPDHGDGHGAVGQLGGDLPVPDGGPKEPGVGLGPLPPAVGEDPPAAGGTARGHGVEPVEQVGVGLEPGQVALDPVEAEPAVGDHPVPVGHQVVLGHRGQAGQVGLLEPVGVDPGQPLAVPGRGRLGHPEQVAQAVPPLPAQPVGRPAQPLDVLGHEGHQGGQVPLPEVLVLGHRRLPSSPR